MNGQFYRTKLAHTSSQIFDASNFVRLPFLPQVGGRSAIFRTQFDKIFTRELPYGTLVKNNSRSS